MARRPGRFPFACSCPYLAGMLPTGTSPAHLLSLSDAHLQQHPFSCAPADKARGQGTGQRSSAAAVTAWPRQSCFASPGPDFLCLSHPLCFPSSSGPREPHTAALSTNLQNHKCPNHCKTPAKHHCKSPVRLGQWWCHKGMAGLSQ